MQPWWAEETSLKNINNPTDPKLLNGNVYIPICFCKWGLNQGENITFNINKTYLQLWHETHLENMDKWIKKHRIKKLL